MHQVPVKIGRSVPDASDSHALGAHSYKDGIGPFEAYFFPSPRLVRG